MLLVFRIFIPLTLVGLILASSALRELRVLLYHSSELKLFKFVIYRHNELISYRTLSSATKEKIEALTDFALHLHSCTYQFVFGLSKRSHGQTIMRPALLVATDSTSHVHLIIGSNSLAGARCTRSLEVGAKPKLIAPADATMHYGLAKRIEDGEVEWLQKDFADEDLQSLGREEVDRVVDSVFITSGRTNAFSKFYCIHISALC